MQRAAALVSGARRNRDGAGAEGRRRGGTCQAARIAAGTASEIASHHAYVAARATAATAGTVAAGASAASLGAGFGDRPPSARPARGGIARALRTTAKTAFMIVIVSGCGRMAAARAKGADRSHVPNDLCA